MIISKQTSQVHFQLTERSYLSPQHHTPKPAQWHKNYRLA